MLAAGLALCAALGQALLAGPAAAQDAMPDQLLQPDPAPLTPAQVLALTAHPAAPAGSAESLPALLARVLARDPQVRAAASLLQAVQERRTQARSRLGPNLTLLANQGRSIESEFGRTIDRSNQRVEAGLRWNLYNGGNDLAELGGATRDMAAATQDLRRAREDTAERLAETYVELLRLQTLLPRAADRLAAVQHLTAQVRRQNDAGKASDADAAQAAASLLDAEIVLDQLRADHDSARAKLAAQAGTDVRDTVPLLLLPAPGATLPENAAVQTATVQTAAGLVAAARLRADAARQRVRPTASLLAPRIDLELRQQLSDRTRPELTTQQQKAWLLVARWDIPVLGEAAARRNETERRAEAAEAEADRVARGVAAELASLVPRIVNADRAVAQLDRQIGQYDQLVRAGELQFEAGRRSVAQLIGLRESRYNTEQRRAEQAQRLLAAQLRQLALTGGLLSALGLGTGIEGDTPP